MPRFVDTNVLIYAFSAAPDETAKQATAQRLLRAEDLVLSVQVLQEFYHQVTRPGRPGRLSHESAIEVVEQLSTRAVPPLTIDLFRTAAMLSQRYQISYWGAAIIAAADAMDCDAVYSEDLNSGQDYGGVLMIDTFAVP